jgi:hypothetical protein
MFLAVTVVAAWLGWALGFIRERQSLCQQIEADGGHVISSTIQERYNMFGPRPPGIAVWRRLWETKPSPL